MNFEEYNKVKDFTYLEYCDYLQDKYGIGLADYMTKSYNKNPKVSRTKEGLYAHHKMESRAIKLSDKNFAKNYPFEWQHKENIVYCDGLEHLLLHILTLEYPDPEAEGFIGGGTVAFLVPELNDLYSGWETEVAWQKNCHSLIKDNKDVYLLLIERLIKASTKKFKDSDIRYYLGPSTLCRSAFDNLPSSSWSGENNESLYNEITEIYTKFFEEMKEQE